MMLEGSSRARPTAVLLLAATLLSGCSEGGGDAPAPASASAALNTGAAAPGSGVPATAQSAQEASRAAASPIRGTAWVVFGTGEAADTIFAEVARTADQRAEGLMYREQLDENAGMLFVFQDLAERAFWMQNTFIPLDIAYMDPSFRVIDILPMEPESEEMVESSGPAQYALEVNRGWFEEHGVEVGDTPRIVFGM